MSQSLNQYIKNQKKRKANVTELWVTDSAANVHGKAVGSSQRVLWLNLLSSV